LSSAPNRYQLPLRALTGYLEPTGAVPFEARNTDGTFRRVWPCGCSAHYRDSVHQTAAWRPCAAHRSGPQPGVEPPRAAAPVAHVSAPEFVSRRQGPRFCIVDTELQVLYESPGADVVLLIEAARGVIDETLSLTEAAVVPLEEDSVLRIVPIKGTSPDAYALFVESVSSRGSLSAAARRFGLTRREVDVLRLLVASQSSAEIARQLCIARSTVADHVQSLFRKTKCTKRTELLNTFFQT
jgi:DNA-binding CsgD family transcriptional regulator